MVLRLTAPMTLEEVRAVLADQIAEPASWRAVPVLDSGETAYVFTSPPDGWFQDWQAARRALPQTGRWPIAVTFWGGPEDDGLFSRAEMEYSVPDLDVSPLAILSRIDTVDVDRMLDDHEARDGVYFPDDEHLAFMLGETVKRVGSAPGRAACSPGPVAGLVAGGAVAARLGVRSRCSLRDADRQSGLSGVVYAGQRLDRAAALT